uniref:Ubiquitin-like-conjugating enzyme ATG10 n=1 Tax=Anopheles christyi TaxID=43041 RepID=A0A182K787_9DIPT
MHLQDFIFHCDQLVQASQNFADRWRWEREKESVYICLKKTRHVPSTRSNLHTVELQDIPELDVEDDPGLAACCDQHTDRILLFEYHVMYSESYEVPTLLFNIYKEGGARLNLDEAWDVLHIRRSVPSHERYSAITMVHHPILYRPFLSLHPCKTAELIGSLSGSTNPILSFLTTYAPYVNLEQDELVRAFHIEK